MLFYSANHVPKLDTSSIRCPPQKAPAIKSIACSKDDYWTDPWERHHKVRKTYLSALKCLWKKHSPCLDGPCQRSTHRQWATLLFPLFASISRSTNPILSIVYLREVIHDRRPVLLEKSCIYFTPAWTSNTIRQASVITASGNHYSARSSIIYLRYLSCAR